MTSARRLQASLFSNLHARHLALTAILLAIVCLSQGSAAQNTIYVNTTIQGNSNGLCSLQEAIYSAEFGANIAIGSTDPDATYTTGCVAGSGNGDTIVLPNDVFQFSTFWDGDAHNPFGPTATPIIFATMTIQGNGATLEWTGAGKSRLFAVGYASITVNGTTYSGTGNLTLQDVNVKGFQVMGGDGVDMGGGGLGAGGAIYVGKTPGSGVPGLTVENSTFQSNGAVGGNGGPQGNTQGGGGGLAGNGGQGRGLAGGGGGGGATGNGGNGSVDCNVCESGAGGGGGGTVFSGGDSNLGLGGAGGYLCGGNGGDDGNDGHAATCAGGGGGGGGFESQNLGANGKGGDGNYGGGGGGGTTNDGGQGGFGGGGGSAAGTGSGGHGGFGGGGGGAFPASGGSVGRGGSFGGNGGDGFGGGGGGALGGAIFNDSGNVTVQNSTFYNDFVDHGLAGGGDAVNGADAGGAIFSRNGSLTVQNVTISGNQATGSGGGIEVMNDGATTLFVLDNTIIANNGAQECITSGTITTKGSANNLIVNNSGCPNVTVTSDPQLGPLQLNSPGDTPTMAIQYGTSPAVDAGDDATALATDQRGVSRPQGPHSDIGAYEAPPPSADLSITKSVSPTTAQPGDTVTYALAVNNAGPNTANSVTVSDTLPSQLTFVSCTADAGGTCTLGSGTVTVRYATLANGASSTITINTTLNSGVTDGLQVGNSASVSASSPTDPNTNNNSSTAYFTIHNRADLAVTKSVSTTSPYAPQVEVGDSLTYTVTLTNKGPYDARSVVLSDSAPAGVTFTGCTASVGSCVWSASSASLSLSSFTNNSAATLTIQATLNFGVADGSTITNTASVTATTFDPDTSNNAASASFTALNNSDLYVFQSATKLKNRQLKYTINVKNLGKYIAKQAVLTDPIPSGSYFVSITPGAWSCSSPPPGSGGTISCALGSEAVNVTQTLIFVVKVTTPGSVLITNTASVNEATFDPNTANNTSTLTTKVGP